MCDLHVFLFKPGGTSRKGLAVLHFPMRLKAEKSRLDSHGKGGVQRRFGAFGCSV